MCTSATCRHIKHGMRKSPEYFVWRGFVTRCENPNNHAFAHYGGRGITVCARWRQSFAEFYADMGPRPSPKHSIDRIDVDGDYEPSNCRWATATTQIRNKRNTLRVEYRGEMVPVAALAESHGIRYVRLFDRIKAGWPIEVALSAPLRSGKSFSAGGVS